MDQVKKNSGWRSKEYLLDRFRSDRGPGHSRLLAVALDDGQSLH